MTSLIDAYGRSRTVSADIIHCTTNTRDKPYDNRIYATNSCSILADGVGYWSYSRNACRSHCHIGASPEETRSIMDREGGSQGTSCYIVLSITIIIILDGLQVSFVNAKLENRIRELTGNNHNFEKL